MVAITVGDIVEVTGFAGRWTVIRPVDNPADPARRQWRVRHEVAGRPPQGRTVGDDDLVVLEHPIFEPGQMVTFFGNEAEVVRDDGASVRLRYLHLRGRSLDRLSGRSWRRPSVRVGLADVARGDLVAEQLDL